MSVANENSWPVRPVTAYVVNATPATTATEATHPGAAGLNLRQLWQRLVRQQFLFWLVLLSTLLLAALLTWMLTPQFRAVATLQIEKQGAQVVDFGELNRTGPDLGDTDPFFRTQYEQLKSRALAEKVIEQLNLEQRLFTRRFGPELKYTLQQRIGFMLQPLQELALSLRQRWFPAEPSPPVAPDRVDEFLEKLFIETGGKNPSGQGVL
ncbi:MAG: Wzz/FepE/Etk N-terminal domain-containing protein [Thiolinea sp.]